MKKLLSIILGLGMMAAIFTGCSSNDQQGGTSSTPVSQTQTTTPVDMNVLALKGPTAMGLVKFMNDYEEKNITDNNYNFSIAASIDEVTPKIVKGEVDIAAVPANVASVLYNNTDGGVQVLAVNTLGVLYIVETGNTVSSVQDLKGKTIYASGKGATPEYALNYILSQNGIDPEKDVTIEWKSEHAECVAALAASENAIAMLPQPFVTTAQIKNSNIRTALDLTKEWDKLQENSNSASALITGVVVARTDFVKNNPQAVKSFMAHYEESVKYINNHVEQGAALVGKYDIVPEAVAKKAVPACNITFISGNDMKERLSGYLTVLMEQNPKAIGGSLPDADFYYNA